ncbi:MAG: hypothetical protein IJQ85_06165 [Selenomonadaceae bacterium]|nr:hypothetical protein [Selenomonadaceae bacterium]
MQEKYFLAGLLFWSVIIFLLYKLRPSSSLHAVNISSITRREKIISLVVMTILIAACTIPMAWNPNWSGELHKHHNQYSALADAFLKGQLYLDMPVDSRLAAMENPYDPKARDELNLDENSGGWDHAFYKGHYYVYFGAVPALIIFLPYQLIVGKSLAAYHATQIFAGFFIVGLFALLFLFAKKFFPRMSFGVYLTTAFTFSLVSILYCTEAPALYCAASSSGLCMEVWSVYFFARAAWFDDSRRKFLTEIFFGAILGALAFGCKPTVALANFLVLPLLPALLKKSEPLKILSVLILPYLVTGAVLMTYNYLRFDNAFEFGQAYQLTVTDQHAYGKFSERFNPSAQIDGLLQNFFGIDNDLPKVDNKPSGALRYAIFWLMIFLLTPKIFSALWKNKLIGPVIALIVTPIIITAFQIHWTPFLLERYRIEIYWLLALLSFIAIGFLSESKKNIFNFAICVLSVVTIFQCLNLFFIPNDLNFAQIYPDLRPTIFKILSLGFG